MKRLIPIAGILTLALVALVLVQCEEILGGAPLNPRVEMDTDSTVKVSWTAPVEGTPDKYLVSFQAVGASGFTQIYEGTATEYIHDPDGATGTYKIEAKFGSNTYPAATNPSTVPIPTAAATVAELNATGNSGYGWNQSTGEGSTYSMDLAANAPNIDFYITDWATGFAGATYSIASPDQALAAPDPGAAGVVETGPWRVNAFGNLTTDPQAPLPRYIAQTNYFNFTDLETDPAFIPCYLKTEGYYALVKVSGRNPSAGTVQVESWFQLVKGLRLIKH